MREIKFRAWYSGDIEKGEPLLFEQEEIDYELYFVCKENPEFRYAFYIPFLDHDWILEQYTGLKDKNGVEIYEGDRLSMTDEAGKKGIVTVGFEKGGILKNNIEVVGNIHDKEKQK